MKEKSKAQLKREKDQRNFIYSNLNRVLAPFKNDYLEQYSKYCFNQKESKLEALKADYAKLGYESDYRENPIKRLETELSRKALLNHQYYNEAAENYETKLNNLVTKIVNFEFDIRHMRVKTINSGNANEFSFLITNETMEIHARAIFVWGHIQTPHYRFIITKRIK